MTAARAMAPGVRRFARQAWHGDDRAIGVFWLPPYPVSLIGGIRETLYVGATTFLMSPTAFIKREVID